MLNMLGRRCLSDASKRRLTPPFPIAWPIMISLAGQDGQAEVRRERRSSELDLQAFNLVREVRTGYERSERRYLGSR
jgi:hypothetical protein